MISSNTLSAAMSFETYEQLLETLLSQGKTTGTTQNDEFLNYAKVNLQRMHRLHKTLVINQDLLQALTAIKGEYIWLVITEGWCGDASQNLPYLQAIAKVCPKINLRLILRDEHPDIIDQYLTDGGRAIPKLICLKKEGLHECFVWGPRPLALQTVVLELKHKGGTKEEKGLVTQKWYNANAGQELQKELISLIKSHMP